MAALLGLTSLGPPLRHQDARFPAFLRVSEAAAVAFADAPARLGRVLMQRLVLLLRECDEVCRCVVLAVTVDVVDLLAGLKASAVRFFPYKSVLGDVSARIREMVIRQVDEHISASADLPTPGLRPLASLR